MIDQVNKKIKIIIPNSFTGKINHSHIRWNDHKGEYFIIEYDKQFYNILIDDVIIDKQILHLKCGKKEIDYSMASIGNKLKEQAIDGETNGGKLLYLVSNNVLLGDTGHNALIFFKYKIGTHIQNDKNDYIITGIFTKKDVYDIRKFYNIRCNKCGWDGYMSEDSISNNCQCQCCSNEIVVHGINDIFTTDNWAFEYFINNEDTHNYHTGSNVKVDMRCPLCGQIYKNISISQFFKNVNHLNCPCNKTHASYPERFVFNMFKLLGVDQIIPQATKKDLSWANSYRYDFYLPLLSCIIETHGPQHYMEIFGRLGGKTYQQEQENDNVKEKLAKLNGIKHYIILDCRFSDVNWIKTSVMNSDLPELIGFSENDINWKICDKNSRSELFIDVCNTYENNLLITKSDLSKLFGLKEDTIRRYLKKGTDLSLCDFNSQSIREKLNNKIITSVILIYYNNILIRVCSSTLEAHKNSLEIFGQTVSEHRIVNAIQNNFDINGRIVFRNYNITTYMEYIDFLCEPNNYYQPFIKINERNSLGVKIESKAYKNEVLILITTSREKMIEELNKKYNLNISKSTFFDCLLGKKKYLNEWYFE